MRNALGLILALALGLPPAYATEGLVSVDVALGDVSIYKVPFLMAADGGIYERNGLDIHQFITPNAAEVARNSGVVVPPETVGEDIDTAARFVRSAVEAVVFMKRDRAAFNASLAKSFNITDVVTQERMYAVAKEFPNKPYPAVKGIRAMITVYDSPQMRMHKAEEFYDTSFIEELDRDGTLDALSQ